MPKIDVNKDIFTSLYKHNINKNSLEKYLPYAKAEWDGEENNSIKIELNDTNRPDLWSTIGLARCLNNVRDKKFKEYDFFSSAKSQKDYERREFVVDKNYPQSRPFSAGFCATGKAVSEEILHFLIQWQEKIHANYGRKRKSISMGLYRLNDIKFPVTYKAVNPKDISFIPLHETEVMNGYQVLEKTEKGKEFAHLLKDESAYPLLCDKNGNVLSMPPIINSNDTGALQVGDSDIFVEVSGQYLKQVLLVINMLSCDMCDLGFTIKPVKVNFNRDTEFGTSIVSPYYFQESVKCTKSDIARILGKGFRITSAIPSLRKMGVKAEKHKEGVLKVYPAPYRNDYLHPCDVVEDIAIGYGFDNLKLEPIKDWTIGRLSNSEIFSRKIKPILVGLGYNEMIFNYLSSKKEYVDNMLVDDSNVVYIENPMSENYRVVRPSVIPSLLKSESLSQSSVFPHQIFEIGKVCFKDANSQDGVSTINSLGLLESSSEANYNKCISTLNALMFYLDKPYKVKKCSDVRFINGRCAEIIVCDKRVGIMGEISPQILENWGVLMPCFAIEMNIDEML